MKKPVRTQSDEDQQKWSRDASIDFTGTEDLARQEFKEDTETNNILNRYGVNATNLRQPVYGTMDYDVDLQGAIMRTQAAQELHASLPDAVRDRFPTWEKFVLAIAQGEITLNPEDTSATKATSTNQQSIPGGLPAGSGDGGTSAEGP